MLERCCYRTGGRRRAGRRVIVSGIMIIVAATVILARADEAELMALGGGTLVITTESLPGASLYQSYYQQLSATGGVMPYTWGIYRGTLPPGLAIDAATGTILGMPSQAGSFRFRVKVKDASQPRGDRDRRRYSLEVTGSPVKYACDHQGGCIPDPNGPYSDPGCAQACSPNTSSPDLDYAFRLLQQVAAEYSITSCPTWTFLDAAVKRLRETNTRWGYHRYPRTKSTFVISQDRIAWYKGAGAPVDGSHDVLAYDIISNYCSRSAVLRRPSLVHSSEFDYQDKWSYPRGE